jgi:hypothetical protein
MKTNLFNKKTLVAGCSLYAGILTVCQAQVVVNSPANYNVTTPGSEFEFVVNGQSSGDSPGIGIHDSLDFSLNAGAKYIFSMNTASFHPVDICTAPNTTTPYSGASAQAVSTGTVTLTIPATGYPTTLYYICNLHSFYGTITVKSPQPPPTANITGVSVSTNITLTFSGGTNTIGLTPQFSSNLVNGAWLPVPSYTNTFNTNGAPQTTSFGRLDAVCGPDVYLRISQAPN